MSLVHISDSYGYYRISTGSIASVYVEQGFARRRYGQGVSIYSHSGDCHGLRQRLRDMMTALAKDGRLEKVIFRSPDYFLSNKGNVIVGIAERSGDQFVRSFKL